MFGLASLLVIGFVIAFVFLPIADQGEDVVAAVRNSNLALGLTLGLALFLIGTGAIHWAKLMPDHEVVHERPVAQHRRGPRGHLAEFEQGAEDSGFGRRKLIRNSLIGDAAASMPAVVLLRDLGPLPGNVKNHTLWGKDVRVMTDAPSRDRSAGRPRDRVTGQCHAGDLRGPPRGRSRPPQRAGEVGGDHGPDVARGDRRRPGPGELERRGHPRLLQDLHVGCPINLYEQTSHNVLCPCHQSTFDLADNGQVIFGPAARNLPQLPLTVDDEDTCGTERLHRAGGTELLGAGMSVVVNATGKVVGFVDDRITINNWLRRNLRKVSPTTGRSCSARSPSTASSCCSCRGRF